MVHQPCWRALGRADPDQLLLIHHGQPGEFAGFACDTVENALGDIGNAGGLHVTLAEHGQPEGQAIVAGSGILLRPAFADQMIEQALDAALRHVESFGQIGQPMAAPGFGHRLKQRQAVGKL